MNTYHASRNAFSTRPLKGLTCRTAAIAIALLWGLQLSVAVKAQHFSEAPPADRPVKQITEWTTIPEDERYQQETRKETEYGFRKDGQLEWIYFNNQENESRDYEYDAENRLKKVVIRSGSGETAMNYRYQPGLKIAEIKQGDLHLKNMQYLDEQGRVVEEKEYEQVPGMDLKLNRRILYNYNREGKLFAERLYLQQPGGEISTGKRVITYDAATGLRTGLLEYNEKEEVEKEFRYSYDPGGRIQSESFENYVTGDWTKTEYQYKNQQLWQVFTTDRDGYRYHKIFKDGILIRYKVYKDNELKWIPIFSMNITQGRSCRLPVAGFHCQGGVPFFKTIRS